MLQGSANLEFWETYQLPEVYQQLVAADNVLATVLKEHNDEAAVTETETVSAEGTETTATETVTDNAAATSEADSLLQQIAQDKPEAQANQSMEEFAKQHPLFALLQINQYNGQLGRGAAVGVANVKRHS